MVLRPPKTPVLKTIWTPLPKQLLALSCPVGDMLYGGSVGGGKSDFIIGAFVKHAFEFGGHAQGVIVRRTLPELRHLKKRCRQLLPQLGATWHESSRTWTFPNGATLLLTYLENDDDATRFQGTEMNFLAVDEAGAFKDPAPIDYLRSRMRSPVPGVRMVFILTANPGGKGHKWLVERYIKPAKPYTPFEALDDEGQPLGFQRVYIPSRLTDNPYLMADPAYVGRIRASGPRWLVKALLMGDWNIAMNAGVLKREWWREYSMLPNDTPMHVIQSWDTSYGKSTRGDRSVCTTWAVYPNGYYLLDTWAGRLDFAALKAKAVDLANKWRCWEVLVEDAASGQSLIQELKRETKLAIRPVKPVGDKTTRAFAVSPLVESGRVFIPAAGVTLSGRFPVSSEWRSDFLDETAAFPEGAHDDIVDSATQALHNLAQRYTVGPLADHSYSLEDIYAEDAADDDQ